MWLTCQDGGHHGSKHEEENTEDMEARIVEHFGGVVSDLVVHHPNEEAHRDVCR